MDKNLKTVPQMLAIAQLSLLDRLKKVARIYEEDYADSNDSFINEFDTETQIALAFRELGDALRATPPVPTEATGAGLVWVPGLPRLHSETRLAFAVKLADGKVKRLWWLEDYTLDNHGDETPGNTGWYTCRQNLKEGYALYFEQFTGEVTHYRAEVATTPAPVPEQAETVQVSIATLAKWAAKLASANEEAHPKDNGLFDLWTEIDALLPQMGDDGEGQAFTMSEHAEKHWFGPSLEAREKEESDES